VPTPLALPLLFAPREGGEPMKTIIILIVLVGGLSGGCLCKSCPDKDYVVFHPLGLPLVIPEKFFDDKDHQMTWEEFKEQMNQRPPQSEPEEDQRRL